MPEAPSKPARLAVLLSGSGRTLLNLLDAIRSGRLHAEIPLVIASRECPGAQHARDANIHTIVIPGDIPAATLGDLFAQHRIDFAALAGYLRLINIPAGFEGRAVNIHPALLPAFGGKGMYGRHVHAAVLAAKHDHSGCTVHYVDPVYDRGNIIAHSRVQVLPGDDAHTLAARVFEAECELYPRVLQDLLAARECERPLGRLMSGAKSVRWVPPQIRAATTSNTVRGDAVRLLNRRRRCYSVSRGRKPPVADAKTPQAPQGRHSLFLTSFARIPLRPSAFAFPHFILNAFSAPLRSPLLSLCTCLCLCLCQAPARAEPPPPGQPRTITEEDAEAQRAKLEKDIFAAFARNDHAAAEAGLRELIPLDKDNFVPWYNLACALALQGKHDEAITMLRQSIARGFTDLRQMETDPNLTTLRPLEPYKAIVAGWDRHLDRRIDDTLEAARKVFCDEGSRGKYTIEKDETLRLAYVSAFDATVFEQSKAEIARLTKWWDALVLPTDEPLRTGAKADRKPPWVLVILPTRPDYARWASRRFGDRWQSIGGNYSHDNKQLVAMDLGASVRHEYWHVLHWRHMDQLGQRQPIWVMEGLCSLVEDIEPLGDSSFKALSSWRTNMARRLAKGAALTPWEVLFALDQKRFIGSRPLAFYAQSRAIFMFLHERGRLRDWYTHYVRGFDEDQTGKTAFEKTFAKPLKEIEKDFRLWLKDLPEVQEVVGRGPANLPFDIGPGAGDGPTIDSIPTGPTRDAGLKLRDVITAIDSKPVRDLNDLARILGEYEPGAQVELAYRRGGKHGTAKVTLIPPKH